MLAWPSFQVSASAFWANIQVFIEFRITGWAVLAAASDQNVQYLAAVVTGHGTNNSMHSDITSAGYMSGVSASGTDIVIVGTH
jgi:hypothetical protein